MPGPAPVVAVGAAITCPHGGVATVVTSNARVLAGGTPVSVLSDQHPVAGCAFQVPVPGGTKPQPCITLRWMAASTRVQVMGQPVLEQLSVGLAYSAEQIPQGPPIVTAAQPRVVVT